MFQMIVMKVIWLHLMRIGLAPPFYRLFRHWKHIAMMWNVWFSFGWKKNSTSHELFPSYLTQDPLRWRIAFVFCFFSFSFGHSCCCFGIIYVRKSSAICHFTLMFIVRFSWAQILTHSLNLLWNSYVTDFLHIVESWEHESFKLKFLIAYHELRKLHLIERRNLVCWWHLN